MSEFKSERFHVSLIDPDTFERESVIVEVGLEGLKLLTSDSRRTLRNYALKNISRWELEGATLTLFTKTNSTSEERQLTLRGDDRTCQLLLDTLTCFFFQKSEMRNASSGDFSRDSGPLQSLRRKKESKSAEEAAVDEVEFWTGAEKEGYMYSQGEVIKTWRRRWFVLKSGFLFRFLNSDIDAMSKPRGVLDLSSVTDITEGSSVTGKQHSMKLSTATGYVCFVADSETDLVEWLSALDKAHTEIVKRVAGVDDQDRPLFGAKVKSNRSSDMVSVVGYESFAATAPPETSSTSDLALNYGDVTGVSRGMESPAMASGNAVFPMGYGPATAIPQPSLYPNPIAPSVYTPPYTHNSSILDQAPQQTPMYPSFHSVRAPEYRAPTPPQPLQSTWQVFHTPEGRAYYYNRSTGESQWERPPGLVM